MNESLVVRDMLDEDGLFISTCGHLDATEEDKICHGRRLPWIRAQYNKGFRAKVAISDGQHAGFLLLSPIEIAAPGLRGVDLSVIKCLAVEEKFRHIGIGSRLVAEAESEAVRNKSKGIATVAFYHDFWFMPAKFFEHEGYSIADRSGNTALMWKSLDKTAIAPSLCPSQFQYTPVSGKTAVDLFWSDSCRTTCIEAENVRQVVSEFGGSVVLRDHCVDDPAVCAKFQISRGIFINGRSVCWGHEAPKDGLRDAIREAQRA